MVASLLVFAPIASADGPPLPTRLAQALAVPGNSPASSAAIAVDLTTGGVVFARHPDASLAPASNEIGRAHV